MRDKIIHGYFGVDNKIIWNTSKNIFQNELDKLIKLYDSLKE